MHTAFFFFFVIASYAGFMSTYIESKYGSMRSAMHHLTGIYAAVLTVANIIMIVVYVIQGLFANYGYGSNNPNAEACNEAVIPSLWTLVIASSPYCSKLPGQVVIVANWFWFFVFIVAPYFIPPELPITESYEIGELGPGEAGGGIEMH